MGLGLICRRSRVHLRPSVWFLGSSIAGPFRNSHHELFYTPRYSQNYFFGRILNAVATFLHRTRDTARPLLSQRLDVHTQSHPSLVHLTSYTATYAHSVAELDRLEEAL